MRIYYILFLQISINFLASDAVKWLDIHRTSAAAPGAKLVVRTKNPAPNPAHPGFAHAPHPTASAHSPSPAHPPYSLSSAHSGHPAHPTLWTHGTQGTHSRGAAPGQGPESSRFTSPSLVYAGKKIDTRNLDVGTMQKASVIILFTPLSPFSPSLSSCSLFSIPPYLP